MLCDIAIQRKSNVEEAEVDDEVLFNGGEDFHWHTHGLESLVNLSAENLDHEEIKQWLPTVSEEALNTFKREGNDFTLYDVNPRLVNKLQMLIVNYNLCLLYTSPSPRDGLLSRMPSSA